MQSHGHIPLKAALLVTMHHMTIGAFNEEELHLFILNHITNEVVVQVNMFNALFLDRLEVRNIVP
jgi:hypothetical protein